MVILDKNNLESMPYLMDEIHDRYFHFDDIVFDSDSAKCKLFLGEKKKGLFGKVVVTKILKITGATHCHCSDIAGIGQNSINEVHIDLDKGTINIECNAPAELKISVHPDFKITIEQI